MPGIFEFTKLHGLSSERFSEGSSPIRIFLAANIQCLSERVILGMDLDSSTSARGRFIRLWLWTAARLKKDFNIFPPKPHVAADVMAENFAFFDEFIDEHLIYLKELCQFLYFIKLLFEPHEIYSIFKPPIRQHQFLLP